MKYSIFIMIVIFCGTSVGMKDPDSNGLLQTQLDALQLNKLSVDLMTSKLIVSPRRPKIQSDRQKSKSLIISIGRRPVQSIGFGTNLGLSKKLQSKVQEYAPLDQIIEDAVYISTLLNNLEVPFNDKLTIHAYIKTTSRNYKADEKYLFVALLGLIIPKIKSEKLREQVRLSTPFNVSCDKDIQQLSRRLLSGPQKIEPVSGISGYVLSQNLKATSQEGAIGQVMLRAAYIQFVTQGASFNNENVEKVGKQINAMAKKYKSNRRGLYICMLGRMLGNIENKKWRKSIKDITLNYLLSQKENPLFVRYLQLFVKSFGINEYKDADILDVLRSSKFLYAVKILFPDLDSKLEENLAEMGPRMRSRTVLLRTTQRLSKLCVVLNIPDPLKQKGSKI